MTNNVKEISGLYPMRVAARLTGLTADTIRVWERRYGVVDPDRTEGNKR
jgi:DNA-binding transcriptional MerR regulator